MNVNKIKTGIVLLITIAFFFTISGCMSSGATGSAAGIGAGVLAGALGADSATAGRIAQGVSTGVSTMAESIKAADSLTAENEYYLGRAVAANIMGTRSLYRNPALLAYVNKICNAIVINSPRPDIFNGYRVAVLDTNEINAFATPGGHIFVTRGLIACAATEDALAAVIAHEVAHIQLRHALTSIRNARYVNAAVSGTLAGLSEAAGGNTKELAGVMEDSVKEVITTMVTNGFSPSQEYEADTVALSLLASAGYQPNALLDMLLVLKQRQQGSQGFGKTHPSPDNRINNVNKNIGKHRVEDTRSYRADRFAAMPR